VAKKNANGEGSRPRKRPDGRWEGRYWSEGKRRSIYGNSRKEVADKLADALSDDGVGVFVSSNITVTEFLAQYEDAVKHTMKRRSFETYQSIAKVHLLPAFGDIKLKDLRREQVQHMYSLKCEVRLSAARVRRIHGALSSALNHAVRWGLIEHNVCKEVSPPKVPTPEIRPLNRDEARRFLKATECDRYHALYVLGLTSGMRIGEIGGLFWSDLDLDLGVLHVQRSLITGYGQTFEPPKTPNNRRNVVLTETATGALLCHRERQATEGFAVAGDELMFTNTVGKPINPSHLLCRSFKPALKRAGIPNTTFHAATRHTCCCILLAQGVNPAWSVFNLGIVPWLLPYRGTRVTCRDGETTVRWIRRSLTPLRPSTPTLTSSPTCRRKP
jgi:integrase